MELENVAEIEVEIQESGPAGEQGPPGLSAYEVYLVNGGTLSEKEWLESLKGETGSEGYTPIKGKDYFTEEDIASLNIPTKTSQLENDSDFTTNAYVDEAVGTLSNSVNEQLANIDLTETDPTVPEHVKSITEEDIAKWNEGGSELEVYDLEIHFSTSSLGAISSSEGKTNLQALVNHAYQVKTPIAVNIIYSSSAEKQSPELFYVVEENTLYTIQDAYNSDTEIKINGSWTDGVFKISSASRHYKTHGNYLSKTNTTSYTPTSNYHPATKQYVDNAAASAGEKRYIYLTGGYNINTGYSTDYPYFTSEDLATFSEYVTKYYNDSYLNLLPLTIINNRNKQSGVNGLAQVITIHNVYEEFGTIHLDGIVFTPNAQQISGCFNEIHGIGIMLINNSWTNGVFTCTRGGFRNENIDGYLSKTNTKTYTPTSDYHPATKKYVDDAIANIDIPESNGVEVSEEQIAKWDSIADDEVEFSIDYTLAQLRSATNRMLNIGYDETISTSIKSAFEKAAAGDGKLSIILNFKEMSDRSCRYKFYQQRPIDGQNINSNYYFCSHYLGTNYTNVSGMSEISELRIIVNGEWTEGVFNLASIGLHYIQTKFLNTDNSTSYTPRSDYNPATKKYVDDAVSAAITTVLEAEY